MCHLALNHLQTVLRISQNFIPLPRHVEDFEVEDEASVSRLGKVEEEGLYRIFHRICNIFPLVKQGAQFAAPEPSCNKFKTKYERKV